MQLILETEALAIDKDMSTIENIQNEKILNGVEDTEINNCNGNKENIKEVNIINNEDLNKDYTEEIDNNLVNDSKTDDKDVLNSNNTNVIEINSTKPIDTPTEESQKNDVVDVTNSTNVEESTNIQEVKEHDNDDMEYEEDIISIKQDHIEQTRDMEAESSDNTEPKENIEDTNLDDTENLAHTKDIVPNIDDSVAKTIENNATESTENNEPDSDIIDKSVAVTEAKEIDENSELISINIDDCESKVEPSKQAAEVTDVSDTEKDSDNMNKSEDILEDTTVDTAETTSASVKETQKLEQDGPIELKDDMDVEQVIEDSNKKENLTQNVEQDCPIELKDDMDVEEVIEESNKKEVSLPEITEIPKKSFSSDNPILCKLSNTLDILSDDEEEQPKIEPIKVDDSQEKQCINIEDDDDIMLIDEDSHKTETIEPTETKEECRSKDIRTDPETGEKSVENADDLFAKAEEKDSTLSTKVPEAALELNINEKEETKETQMAPEAPLLPDNFLKSAKKNLADMTREELEEFCILRIVESIVDRSNLSEIKNKLKTMAQNIEEYRKKTMMLTKQNRDLQVVLKSVQEEQKKMTPDTPITPLKITRSVGMQVFMEKTSSTRRKGLVNLNSPATNNGIRPNARAAAGQNPRQQKPASNNSIPVPRLVPANGPAIKSPNTTPVNNQGIANKTGSPMPNGIKTPSPVQKQAEKRQLNRSSSVTVDLTDDEPPSKMNNTRTSPAPPVRVVPSQNLMATPRQQFPTAVSSPRKVYIPISGPQSQNIRPGQTIMLKTVPPSGLRPRGPTPSVARMQAGSVRVNRIPGNRHPAPLPDCIKQYQPPNWKALPPAPDLKLSKVENGIVISWKIEGYQEDSYEEIASYQLYAYQETSLPPSTSLWKKIGDVKALPLPMACTLTQFMAGFKYYFAVRAVDIRSRVGPFSLPGSILLLNKL